MGQNPGLVMATNAFPEKRNLVSLESTILLSKVLGSTSPKGHRVKSVQGSGSSPEKQPCLQPVLSGAGDTPITAQVHSDSLLG